MLSFEDGGGQFHLPIRCDEEAIEIGNGLCAKCIVRQVRTEKKLEEIGDRSTIGGMLPSYLHGKITEPIPYWSRLYDGAWYRLKVAGGCRVSEDTMARAKKAVAAAAEGTAQAPEPEAIPTGAGRRGRKKVAAAEEAAPVVSTEAPAVEKPKKKAKTLAEKKAELARPAQPSLLSFINAPQVPALETLDALTPPTPIEKPAAAPIAKPAAVPIAKPVTPAKKPAKKTGSDAKAKKEEKGAHVNTDVPAPKARIDPGTRADPVDDVQTIRVVSKTLGGKQYYFEQKKEKVYDLRFKYLGRWDSKKECIVAFPDSDAEP
jgi:hypothetical protein